MFRFAHVGQIAGAITGLALVWQPTTAYADGLGRLHGAAIERWQTGPSAGGIAVTRSSGGFVLRDDSRPSFLTYVGRGARYDGFVVEGPHLLIEGVRFDGPLDIYARLPLVMRGTVVRPPAAHWAVHVRPGAGPFLFLWSQAGGPRSGPGGSTGTALRRAKGATTGIGLMLRADHATVHRSFISHAIDGIRPGASHIRIQQSVIEDLVTAPGAHNDGIQILGRLSDIAIVANRIVNPHPQTSAVSIQGHAVRLERNWLAGGGWTVYGGAKGHHTGAPPSSRVLITGNIFGRQIYPRAGYFGVLADWSSASGNIWRDNRFESGARAGP